MNYERNLGYRVVGKAKETESYTASFIPNRLYVKSIRFADSGLVWVLAGLLEIVAVSPTPLVAWQ